MPISNSATTELAQLLRKSTASEQIAELVRQGYQALIKAEAAEVLGAFCHKLPGANYVGGALALLLCCI